MSIISGFQNKSLLKKAIKQTTRARVNEGPKADQLFKSAYEGFSKVIEGDLVKGEALYNWGFALLHQAKTKHLDEAVSVYLEATTKFSFCLLVTPNHLGAAIDGGVAYMDMAREMKKDVNDKLYDLAAEFFNNAERIQRGSAAYNLACISGLKGDEDACRKALEISRDCGSLPDPEDIINDVDLANVVGTSWFAEFMEKVTAEPEPEVIDENAVVYDVEGKIVSNKKKRKDHEFESDGVIYDVEGNVIRRLEPGEKFDGG